MDEQTTSPLYTTTAFTRYRVQSFNSSQIHNSSSYPQSQFFNFLNNATNFVFYGDGFADLGVVIVADLMNR
ncbi:hypothetical protein QVD17_10465 [Tagetes erecta]|uniref:Uncharacterized protein n=1 Tax=Tagetes erecta TaxID=13708 RepID=A0AAD8L3D5_TARER|nr:hypothetical protein QVD17_10465 [Tagetes erecta]